MGQQDLDGSILDAVHQQTGTERGMVVIRSSIHRLNRLLSDRTVEATAPITT